MVGWTTNDYSHRNWNAKSDLPKFVLVHIYAESDELELDDCCTSCESHPNMQMAIIIYHSCFVHMHIKKHHSQALCVCHLQNAIRARAVMNKLSPSAQIRTASDKRTRPGNEATYQEGCHNIQGSIIVPSCPIHHFTIAVARAVITASTWRNYSV